MAPWPLSLPHRRRKRDAKPPVVSGWPFDASEAVRRQKAVKLPTTLKLELPSGVPIELVLIPAGEFVMGSTSGADDEYPPAAVKIGRPFYISRTEITNAQFAAFDAKHDSAVISMPNKDQDYRGYPVNGPEQPAVRVTWQRGEGFLPVGLVAHGPESGPANRGPVGMGRTGGHGHGDLLWRRDSRLRPLRQPGRCLAGPTWPGAIRHAGIRGSRRSTMGPWSRRTWAVISPMPGASAT